jgi:lysozyme
MTTSEKGLALIEHYEGIRTLAYRCPAGVWTIGIGTTIYPDGTPVKEGDRISYKQARDYLMHDLCKIEYQLDQMLTIRLLQHQFDALVSFAYNVGCNALKKSTLLRYVNDRDTNTSIEYAFLMYTKCAGSPSIDDDHDGQVDESGEKQVSQGLTKRRKSEAWLYIHNELKYF